MKHVFCPHILSLGVLFFMPKSTYVSKKIESFGFFPGRTLANKKYEVVAKIGQGWESEVYMLRELSTGIERAAKFFFPHRNVKGKSSTKYAKKLHKLRNCPVLIRYFTQENITFKNTPITFLVSDYVEGVQLSEFIASKPGGRMSSFEALHLLHALCVGLEDVHQAKEYHGDLHSDNIMIQRKGIGFDIRILDPYDWKARIREVIQDDVCNLIRIFYDAIGGVKFYGKQSPEIKSIVCGLKRTLISKKFKTAGDIRVYLDNMVWMDS